MMDAQSKSLILVLDFALGICVISGDTALVSDSLHEITWFMLQYKCWNHKNGASLTILRTPGCF